MLQNVGKPSNLLSNGSKAKYYPPKLESKQKKKNEVPLVSLSNHSCLAITLRYISVDRLAKTAALHQLLSCSRT